MTGTHKGGLHGGRGAKSKRTGKAAAGSESRNRERDLSDNLVLCVESARLEYEYSFKRAERYDNKVYILLTVCAFIFVLLTGAIEKISEIDFMSFRSNFLVAAFDALLVLSILSTIFLLGLLIYSLSGKAFRRYDTAEILEKDLLSRDKKTVAKYTIIQYERARDYNNRLIDQQFKRLNKAVKLLIAVVLLLMMLNLTGSILSYK